MKKKALLSAALLCLPAQMFLAGCMDSQPTATNEDKAISLEPPETHFVNTNRHAVPMGEALAKMAGGSTFPVTRDASGKILMQMWDCSGYDQHPVVSCAIPDPNYVAVGGGAWTEYNYNPGFITACYPANSDLSTWIGWSKDHSRVSPHTLHVYVIGMQLLNSAGNPIPRQTVFDNMILKSSTSGSSAHPSVSAAVPTGYTLIGGGAYVTTSGGGQLLVSSYPQNSSSWYAESKDHIRSSPGTITAFAVGIKPYIPGFGILSIINRNPATSSVLSGIGSTSSSVETGYILTAMGARVNYGSGNGRMVTRMGPNPNNGLEIFATSTDYVNACSGTTNLYYIEAKKQ